MKKNVLTGLAALTLLDLSAEVASAQNWQGPYIGAHVGYRWGDANLTAPAYIFQIPTDPFGNFTSPARNVGFRADGFVGGAHVGYNFLIQPSWLIGIEADITGASASASSTANFISTDGVAAVRTSTVKLGTQGTLRGRLGYVAGPWLAYATGGVAFTQLRWSDTIVAAPPFAATLAANANKTLTGWTVGFGGERAITSSFSVRVQYLYEDFGTETVPLAATTTQTGRLSITTQKVTFGGSFRF